MAESPGDELGRHEITAPFGADGMAEVYEEATSCRNAARHWGSSYRMTNWRTMRSGGLSRSCENGEKENQRYVKENHGLCCSVFDALRVVFCFRDWRVRTGWRRQKERRGQKPVGWR